MTKKLTFLLCLLGFVGLCLPTPAQTSAPGQWTWIAGSSTIPAGYGAQPGVYGTLGTPAPANTPGGRNYAHSWTDSNGNLWLFGGVFSSSTQWSYFNDLWKFDPVAREWVWMNGSKTVGSNCPVVSSVPYCGQSGAYGAQGTPAAASTPGGRYHAATWTDQNGNFWLYGGLGFDANGNWGALSDLWRFNPSSNQWTWMGGSSTIPVSTGCIATGCILGQSPVPGTLGVAAAANNPGGLWVASSWTDAKGNLWLFGGWGYNTSGNGAVLNDLWQFNPSNNQWTWMGGSSTFGSTTVGGAYGVLGQPAPANIPGSRWSEATWTDANGNLWLFGGQGYDASTTEGILNDLWSFNPSTNQWSWEGGSNTLNCAGSPQISCHQPGVYGAQGVPAAANIPGSRLLSFNWRDVNGNLWLMGGQGFGADSSFNSLNDLWQFSPTKDQWTWMGGASTVTATPSGGGIYGALGAPAAANWPGRRSGGVSWTDKSGNFWLWGGVGLDANLTNGYLNDLWVYQPAITALSSSPVPPGFTIAGAAVSIAPGASTANTSTITVTPTGGFTGALALTASLAASPTGAVAPPTFTFTPATVTITGSQAATATLTIATTASKSIPCASSSQTPQDIPWRTGSGALLAGLFLFITPKRNRSLRSLLMLMLSLLALAGGPIGCGGGGNSGSGNKTAACLPTSQPGTSAGTYLITVSAASGALTNTATVSLTVQ